MLDAAEPFVLVLLQAGPPVLVLLQAGPPGTEAVVPAQTAPVQDAAGNLGEPAEPVGLVLAAEILVEVSQPAETGQAVAVPSVWEAEQRVELEEEEAVEPST